MLTLRTYLGLPLELTPGTTLSLEQNNPLLADSDNNGSYALPFTAPRTPANQRALDFPELLDHARGLARSYERTDLFDDGRHVLTGTLRLLRTTPTSYELSLSYGASAVMAKLKATRLRDLTLGGLRVWKHNGDINRYREQLAEHMADVVAAPKSYDYVFAPYSDNDALGDNPSNWPRFANFNAWHQTVYNLATSTSGPGFVVSSGYVTGYPVMGLPPISPFPDFYPFYKLCACPSVKLRYLVYALCEEAGIPLEEDFFDAETSQLVVLGAALAEDNLITGFAQAQLLGLGLTDYWFRLADVLPDLTGAELLRRLADTFFLDISVSPTGALRLRRTPDLLSQPPALVLTRAATPAPSTDVSAELPSLVTAYRTEQDSYTGSHYQLVDANQRGADVATLAQLPTPPSFSHEVRLVTSLNAFYQYTDSAWTFYSEKLDAPTFGLPASPDETSTVSVTQGCELVLELTGPQTYELPVPGGDWPDPALVQPTGVPVQRVPVFGQRAYAPGYNCIDRSQALRLAFYRGMQPYQTVADGTYPMLSAGNLNLQGQVLGTYSLRLDGEAGTVAQFGEALLQLKANPYTVMWPVWLSEEQFYHLDLARKVEIDGLHFVVKRVSLAFPLRAPAELELVLVPPVFSLP